MENAKLVNIFSSTFHVSVQKMHLSCFKSDFYAVKNTAKRKCRVCFVNVQLSLHENVVFSVRARMGNAAYINYHVEFHSQF